LWRAPHPFGAIALAALALVVVPPGSAAAAGLDDLADQWLPRSDGAEWTYSWSNSTYSPTPSGQLRRLAETRMLAGRLRRALLARDAEQIARLLERFRDAASDPASRRLLSDQALAGYARSLQQLNDAYADVQREQAALDRKLR
jgi:hypothetical protein